jgi:hypothetical protein
MHNIEYDAAGRVVGMTLTMCPDCWIAMARSRSQCLQDTSAQTIWLTRCNQPRNRPSDDPRHMAGGKTGPLAIRREELPDLMLLCPRVGVAAREMATHEL